MHTHTVEMWNTLDRTNETVDAVDMDTNACRQEHNCNHKIPFPERRGYVYEQEVDKIPETPYIEVFKGNICPLCCSTHSNIHVVTFMLPLHESFLHLMVKISAYTKKIVKIMLVIALG